MYGTSLEERQAKYQRSRFVLMGTAASTTARIPQRNRPISFSAAVLGKSFFYLYSYKKKTGFFPTLVVNAHAEAEAEARPAMV